MVGFAKVFVSEKELKRIHDNHLSVNVEKEVVQSTIDEETRELEKMSVAAKIIFLIVHALFLTVLIMLFLSKLYDYKMADLMSRKDAATEEFRQAVMHAHANPQEIVHMSFPHDEDHVPIPDEEKLLSDPNCLLKSAPGYLETSSLIQKTKLSYFISDKKEKVNWLMAGHKCSVKGMRLVSLETREKQDDVKLAVLLNDGYLDDFWTSGTNSWVLKDSKYIWSTISQVIDNNYTSWHLTQPNNREKQHCIEFTATVRGNTCGRFMWNNRECTTHNRYICEPL